MKNPDIIEDLSCFEQRGHNFLDPMEVPFSILSTKVFFIVPATVKIGMIKNNLR